MLRGLEPYARRMPAAEASRGSMAPSLPLARAHSVSCALEQYVFMFTSNAGFPLTDSNILLTQQDIKDIIAFLRLL